MSLMLFRNYKKIISFVTVFIISISVVTRVYAVSSIMTWHLVDSGKHLDYDGDSSYMSHFTSATTRWNAYKSGVIRKDSLLTVRDVYISDVDEVDGAAALTWPHPTRKITMNTYHLSGYVSATITNIATHEFGHALGLDHNMTSDVMSHNISSVITIRPLTNNDKHLYDDSYARY